MPRIKAIVPPDTPGTMSAVPMAKPRTACMAKPDAEDLVLWSSIPISRSVYAGLELSRRDSVPFVRGRRVCHTLCPRQCSASVVVRKTAGLRWQNVVRGPQSVQCQRTMAGGPADDLGALAAGPAFYEAD